MLISETLLEAEAELVHSAPIGIGGTCFQAADASPDTRSGRKVPEALRQWAAGHTDFPFTAVVDHYQVVGRNGVRPHVATMLRDIHGKSRSDPVLAEWLPMTFDDNDASYSSYVGLDYFDQVARSADCQRVDAFVAATAIDLALLETRALAAAPRPPQSVRTRAAVRVVSQLFRLAPDFKLNPRVAAEGVAALAETGTNYDSFGSAATLALRSVPEDIGAAVRLTLLPTTRLHDEQMFIRCIQIFEGLYRQIATAISTAITDLLDGNAADAKDRLDRASGRLEAIPALFRVLTTMPVDAFSIIRGFTHGRSAVQSRAFRDVEFACAPRSQRSTDHVSKVHDEQPTLEAVFLAMRHALPDAVPLEQSMRRLDRAWGAMKRGHWGITLKVIGTVPGTGGTAGASYLQSAAKVSLFPGLPEVA